MLRCVWSEEGEDGRLLVEVMVALCGIAVIYLMLHILLGCDQGRFRQLFVVT